MSNSVPNTALELNVHRTIAASSQRGRVVHDTRGNAVWDWAIETTALAQSTVEELLNKLVDPIPLALEIEVERAGRWCGDPYNRC